jgi:hypothetical protein
MALPMEAMPAGTDQAIGEYQITSVAESPARELHRGDKIIAINGRKDHRKRWVTKTTCRPVRRIP